jgi:peptide/nickel transport system ATP-binding protein
MTILRSLGVGKVYPSRGGSWRTAAGFRALADVSFEVAEQESVAIVGRTGAGKSTLARCLAGLESISEGEIQFDAERRLPGPARPIPAVQLVFQHSSAALNPAWTVEEHIAEPLRIQGAPISVERIAALMRDVGLSAELRSRVPAALSGGQRQRVAIARALAAPVRVLLLDEPLSGLDGLSREKIVALLNGLRRERRLSLVYITHDLAAAVRVADRIVVLHAGGVVEGRSSSAFLTEASNPVSRQLIAAMLPEASA